MNQHEVPILEFDPDPAARLEARAFHRRDPGKERCVISFFREVLEELEREGKIERVEELSCETMRLPLYRSLVEPGVHLCLGFLGAAGSAGFLEELVAMGFSKFLVTGGAGVLDREIAVGKLILPTSAVRDEGVSYHYLPPSREVEADPQALERIESYFRASGVDYLKAKTWTTDAIYRETKARIERRKAEGCVVVEMEAAAFFAVAKFRAVQLGQILYGGDDLSGREWDGRSWASRKDVRRNLVEMALRIVATM